MKFCIIDTKSVINEVRTRECLWHPDDDGYKDKSEKQSAWKQVCAAVLPEYDSCTRQERREIERAVQLRWKTARDAYIKCRATPLKSPFKTKYAFYDSLTFLERAKGTESDEANDSQPGTSDQNEEQTDPLKIEETVKPPETELPNTDQRKRRRKMTNFESQLLRKIQNKVNPPKTMSTTSTTNSTSLHDDDQSFFNSLAPIINNFDAYKKLVFRSKILELAGEVGELGSAVKQEQVTFYVNE